MTSSSVTASLTARPDSAPIVYLGPSISADDIAPILPRAIYKRPIQRGDLFRARELGASVFLIIDGVFMQDAAISPREVVEVARDGARIYGASSMGALRAAECWPAGVTCVGVVSRAFRAGILDSDDEVAVALDPERAFASRSVALVNVRYALGKVVRKKLISRDDARRILESALGMFYPHRQWKTIVRLSRVVLPDTTLDLLRSFDIKRADAVSAARIVARDIARDADMFKNHARKSSEPVSRAREMRERFYEAVPRKKNGSSTTIEAIRRELARWLVGSGRIAKRLPVIVMAQLGQESAFAPAAANEARRFISERARVRASHLRSSELRQAMKQVLPAVFADEQALADMIWHELDAEGDLDAELMRMRAVTEASERAKALNLRPRAIDRYLAQQEIAIARGFGSWDALMRDQEHHAWPWTSEAVEILALAKRMRFELFAAKQEAPEPTQPTTQRETRREETC